MAYEVVGRHTGGEWTAAGEAPPRTDEAGKACGASSGVVGRQKPPRRKYAWRKCAVLADERIRLSGPKTQENYPGELRLVTAMVEVRDKMVQMTFITNNFEWSAFSICQLYQCRWGGGGVLQGAEADAAAGRFPRQQRERRALAGLDGAAGIPPAPLHRLAEQMETPVLQAVHAAAGRAVELFQAGKRDRMLRHAA